MHLGKEMYWNDKYNKGEDVRIHSLFVFTIYIKCHKAYLFLLNIQSVKFVLFPTFYIKMWNVTLAYCSLELIC